MHNLANRFAFPFQESFAKISMLIRWNFTVKTGAYPCGVQECFWLAFLLAAICNKHVEEGKGDLLG